MCRVLLEWQREFSIVWWVIPLLGHGKNWCKQPRMVWHSSFCVVTRPLPLSILQGSRWRRSPPAGLTDLCLAAASRTQTQCQRLSGRWSAHLPNAAAQRGPQTNSPPPESQTNKVRLDWAQKRASEETGAITQHGLVTFECRVQYYTIKIHFLHSS